MLNPFPIFITFGLIAPFMLRFFIGLIFLSFGIRCFKTIDAGVSLQTKNKIFNKFLGVIEIIIGVLFVAGFLTQIMVIISSVILLFKLIFSIRKKGFYDNVIIFYLLLFVVCLSLLFSGAGFWAIDFPL